MNKKKEIPFWTPVRRVWYKRHRFFEPKHTSILSVVSMINDAERCANKYHYKLAGSFAKDQFKADSTFMRALPVKRTQVKVHGKTIRGTASSKRARIGSRKAELYVDVIFRRQKWVVRRYHGNKKWELEIRTAAVSFDKSTIPPRHINDIHNGNYEAAAVITGKILDDYVSMYNKDKKGFIRKIRKKINPGNAFAQYQRLAEALSMILNGEPWADVESLLSRDPF